MPTLPPFERRPGGDLEPVGQWLAALIRASSELLDVYVIGGRSADDDQARCKDDKLLCISALSGSTRGEIHCRIDRSLALSAAEGMWGEPAASLSPAKIHDAMRELCGQIIGYAAGEVSARLPGVVYEPPRLYELPAGQTPGDLGLAGPRGGDRAVVPTRSGSLLWEVSEIGVLNDAAERPPPHAITVRDRIRALRDTDLQLLQAVRVLGVDERADNAFEELVRAVGSDPALTARILRRVNSVLMRPKGMRIHTLPQAMLYLGTRAAKNIVVSALLSQPVGSPHPARRSVAAHSVRVATLARALGQRLRLDGDECYLLGLLHDLGRLVLDRLYPDEMSEIQAQDEDDLLAEELRALGITHAEAGAIVAMCWHFPDSVRLAMTAHHDSSVLDKLGLPALQAQQIQVVAQADRLTCQWERGGRSLCEQGIAEVAQVLRLQPAAVRECLLGAAEHFEVEEDLLGDSV